MRVVKTHVHRALQAHEGGRRGAGDTVLAGARLGDDAGFAHAFGEQGLAQHVVDLVRAGVVQVFALEEHSGTTGVPREAGCLGEEAGTAGVLPLQLLQLLDELRVHLRLTALFVQHLQCRDQRLGNITTAERSEPARNIGGVHVWIGHRPVFPWVEGCAPAAIRSATAARGSPPVTSASPTSTACAPSRTKFMTS